MNNKQFFRKQMKEVLAQIPRESYKELSSKIAANLFNQPEWVNAAVIGITLSNPPEPDTYQIIEKAWKDGKKVAVPKCFPKERLMEFRYLTDFSELEKVYSGLSEPVLSITERATPEEITLMIVPGLSYTAQGNRLGFGGGYYDRFLPQYSGKTISLAFDCQIVDAFPVEEHDIKVSAIITDKGVVNT